MRVPDDPDDTIILIFVITFWSIFFLLVGGALYFILRG